MPSLERISINFYSGYKFRPTGCCETLKAGDYKIVQNISVGGDAPKSILRVYEYGVARRSTPRSWPVYIAKTGHKWYPAESITEHLLTKLGACFGLKMAECRLCMINGQLRFLSKYFLKPGQRLVHGAEIYAGLLNDTDFVEAIERQQRAREFFTVEFTKEAIENAFPGHAEKIFKEFLKMLLFDALVGNNDRHFYNWAVIQNVEGKHDPQFSPVYDTARGLFWNTQEEKILSLRPGSKEQIAYIEKYYNKSKPKIGIEGNKDVNHFDLAKFIIKNEFGISKSEIAALFNKENLDKARNFIDENYQGIYSAARIEFIKNCITERFNSIFNF